MFGVHPLGDMPFGGSDQPDQSAFEAKAIVISGQMTMTIANSLSVPGAIARGDRPLQFGAVIRPWRLQQV